MDEETLNNIRKIGDLIVVPIFIWNDTKQEITWANQASYATYGGSLPIFSTITWEHVYEEERPHILKYWQQIMDTNGDSFDAEYRVQTADRSFVWYRVNFRKVQRTQDVYWVGTFNDINDRHNLEELNKKYERQLELFHTTMKQLPVAVIVGEAPSGKLIFGNDKMSSVWGFDLKPSQSIQEYVEWDGFHPDGRKYAPEDWPLARSIMTGEVVVNEVTKILRGDNRSSYISLSSAPVRDKDGNIVAGVVICENLEERLALERKAIQALSEAEIAKEQSRFKSNFIANVSHDIRTPISAVMGLSSLLYLTKLTHEQQEYVDNILSSCKNLVRLVDDILDISKIEAGRFELRMQNFSLNEVLNSVISTTRAYIVSLDKKLSLYVQSDTFPYQVVGDFHRFAQIINNLLSNAVKFTNDGGHINVSLKKIGDMSDEEILVQFSVEDNGIGISEKLQKQLFQPFTQAGENTGRPQYHGSGLGLHIVERLTHLMIGTVSFKSKLGQGSTFYVTIPLKQVKLMPSDKGSSSIPDTPVPGLTKEERRVKRVLLAEDNDLSAMIAIRLLRVDGYENVQWVVNGEEAVKAIQQGTYDIVLMDCLMPIMNGYEASAKIRNMNKDLPIIAFTASATMEEEQTIYKAGMNDVVYKPYTPSDLTSKMDHLLGGRMTSTGPSAS